MSKPAKDGLDSDESDAQGQQQSTPLGAEMYVLPESEEVRQGIEDDEELMPDDEGEGEGAGQDFARFDEEDDEEEEDDDRASEVSSGPSEYPCSVPCSSLRRIVVCAGKMTND